ncbi:MAG: hypothetical protein U1E76_04970 [Planctomycetota bacterium]
MTRTKRSPMPRELWQAAAELVPTHGFHAVMRGLRLGYLSLKRHVRESTGRSSAPESDVRPAAFIDLGIGHWRSPPHCVVTVDDGAGAKMSIELPSTNSGELASLVQAFVSGRQS